MSLGERPRVREIEYPSSDGDPMAETDKHRDLTVYGIEALKVRYAGQRVYVSGDNFIYYEEGNVHARVSPDTYVVFGVEMRQRDSYKAWEEGGRLPAVVIEFTSRKTRREDIEVKLPLYERLGIPEYFMFDPRGDYLKPRLRGFRLSEGRYVPLEVVDGRLHSEVLGLDLVTEGWRLRLYDPATGETLLTPQEMHAARDAERRRAEGERRRAEDERRRAEEARQRADTESAARAAAEAEVARLRAELERRNGKPGP